MAVTRLCPWGRRLYSRITPLGSSRMRYHHLPDELKPAYLDIERKIMSGSSAFDACIRSAEDLKTVNGALCYDNPMLFDFRSYSFRVCCDRVAITLKRRYTADEAEAIVERMRSVAVRLGDQTAGFSEYEKILAVHDFLADGTVYDLESPDPYTAVGPLVHGRGVCGGISSAASFLLNSIGVDCGVMNGKVVEPSNRGNHAWNIVWVDGHGYNMDVTWDLSHNGDYVRHDYLNVSNDLISSTHVPSLPVACTHMDMNYHTMCGTVVYRLRDMAPMLDSLMVQRRRRIEFRLSSAIRGEYSLDAACRDFRASATRTGMLGPFSCHYDQRTGCAVFELM